jgi:hypothetical protein
MIARFVKTKPRMMRGIDYTFGAFAVKILTTPGR